MKVKHFDEVLNKRDLYFCHMENTCRAILLVIILFITRFYGFSQESENMIIVIIDGARYSETFGDPERTHVPEMNQIAAEGVIHDQFYNNHYTYTSRAIPALWCGTWTDVIDTTYNGNYTNYAKLPTLFEYFRKQKNAPPEDCYYVLKYISSLWLPSFNPNYGPDYWPSFHSIGNNDEEVLDEARWVMETQHPRFLWIYLADVDHAGHSGVWEDYIAAIETADEIVGIIWDEIQNNPFYADNTTLFVTNDHGRHDDEHGGFQGHGCGCEGCRHIMFLAAGPGIKEDALVTETRVIPDMAVTASHILNLHPEYATGDIMEEIFKTQSVFPNKASSPINNIRIYPNPARHQSRIHYQLKEPAVIGFSIFDLGGNKIGSLETAHTLPGSYSLLISSIAKDFPFAEGVYLLEISTMQWKTVKKVVITP